MSATIIISHLAPGQKIPRPFNEACCVDEAKEMLAYWQACLNTTKYSERKRFADFARNCPGDTFFNLGNLNTETPVFQHAGHKFYAFTKE